MLDWLLGECYALDPKHGNGKSNILVLVSKYRPATAENIRILYLGTVRLDKFSDTLDQALPAQGFLATGVDYVTLELASHR